MTNRNPSAAQSRLKQEADRIARMKADAARPDGCGSEIVDVAPGRGAVRRFQPREVVRTSAGQLRVARSGHNGHDALARADAFDVMQQQSSRRKKEAPALFTAGQISAGRDYAALYERCASAGVRCSSVEAMGGAGGQGSFIDAVIRDSQRLAALDRAIGSAVVLSPRDAQAHADRGRRMMRASDLVRGVCVEGKTISQMLQSFGWLRSPHIRKKTMVSLCAALDRMQGFRD